MNIKQTNDQSRVKLELDIQDLASRIEETAREARTRAQTQDEIIDLVSVEISKDAKRKSDILIDLDYMKKETAVLQK